MRHFRTFPKKNNSYLEKYKFAWRVEGPKESKSLEILKSNKKPNKFYTLQISQNFCKNIPNFVPKFAKFVTKFKVHIKNLQTGFLNKAFDWTNSIHGPIKGFVYKPACEFQYELLNFATNLRTLERNLEYFGKRFVKSTVKLLLSLLISNAIFNVFEYTPPPTLSCKHFNFRFFFVHSAT